jgi:RNA polymerase sporulation-specific sigma factor
VAPAADRRHEEQLDLLRRAREGEAEAREQLIEQNQRLVWSIVTRFSGRGVELEDLFQIGSIGLWRACERFDPAYGVHFSTYAVPLIIGEVRRYLRDYGQIKVSRRLRERAAMARRAAEELRASQGREPTPLEVAAACDLQVDEVVEALEATQMVHSLDEVIGNGERDDLLRVDRLEDPAVAADGAIDRVDLRGAMRRLPDEEREVLFLRFFRDMTQQEVADRLHTHQVRVSRIERRALQRVRDMLGR